VSARPGPVDRVRAAYARLRGPAAAAHLPRGYQRLGRIVLVRLPEEFRPDLPALGRLYAVALGASAVYRSAGAIEGEWRAPRLERLYGEATETEVLEHGVRWRFDVTRVMFARGNKGERARFGRLVRPGEHVVDLFAGIGYFAIPAAKRAPTVRVTAVEANPLSVRYLEENVRANGVPEQVRVLLGDNRAIALPAGTADRVVLGYLPSAVPWIRIAVPLLRRGGGSLHVHLVVPVRGGLAEAERTVAEELGRQGARIGAMAAREVKAYGPGRLHAVVDTEILGAPR
jgi:tRNA wybutosine-synthesizing protein 2